MNQNLRCKLRSLIVATAAALASCQTFQPRPINALPAAKRIESRRLDDAGLRQFIDSAQGSARTTWDLDTLTLAAFYFHADLDVARARLDIARAAILTAHTGPNPSLSVAAQRNVNAPEGQSPWKLDMGLDVPIETAGKRGIRTKRARQLAESARFDITTTAWQVLARVRTALIDFDIGVQSTTLLDRQQSLQREIVDILDVRRSVGEASLVELMRARIAATQTELLLRDARSTVEQARARLAAAVGIPLAALDSINVVSTLPPGRLPAIEDLRQVALTERSDIRALLAEYAAAESALRLEIARQYPDLHLAPGYSWDQGANKWLLGFSAALPIFDQNRGPIAEAGARRKETGARFTALQAKVIGDLDAASTAYRTALEKLNASDALLSLNEEQAKEIGIRFQRGEADRLELRSAELQVNTIAVSRTSAVRGVQQALGDLEAALQQPIVGLPMPSVEASPRPAEEQ